MEQFNSILNKSNKKFQVVHSIAIAQLDISQRNLLSDKISSLKIVIFLMPLTSRGLRYERCF